MSDAHAIHRITVLGAGTMGHGIAHVAAAAGFKVTVYDLSEEHVAHGMRQIERDLDQAVAESLMTAADRARTLSGIIANDDLEDALKDCDLVIEAAPESLELKHELFRCCDDWAPAHAILASNTATLGLTEIASATRRPGQVLGMHFFNPPHRIKLLEIIRGQLTSAASVEAARSVGLRMGKEVIVATDTPGFTTTRLGVAMANEAIRMVEQGVASPEAIDRAMELGYMHPMGPFRLADLIGLDVRLALTEQLHRDLGGEQFRAPVLLKKMVAAGKLGQKSGEGFYKYPPVP